VHTLPLPEMTYGNFNPVPEVTTKTPRHQDRWTEEDRLAAWHLDDSTIFQLSALSFHHPSSGLWPPSPLRGGSGFTPLMSQGSPDTLSIIMIKGLAFTASPDVSSSGTFLHGSSIRFSPFITIGTRDALTSKNRVGTSAVRGHENRGTFFPTGSGGYGAESRKLKEEERHSSFVICHSSFVLGHLGRLAKERCWTQGK